MEVGSKKSDWKFIVNILKLEDLFRLYLKRNYQMNLNSHFACTQSKSDLFQLLIVPEIDRPVGTWDSSVNLYNFHMVYFFLHGI